MYPHQRDRLTGVLEGAGLAALIAADPAAIAWATASEPDDTTSPRLIVVTPSASTLVAPADGGSLASPLREALAALSVGGGAVGLDVDTLPAREAAAVREALTPRETRSAAALWRRARIAKSPFELECLQRALLILEESLNALVQVLEPGMTAKDAVAVCRTAATRQAMTLETATVSARGGAATLAAGAVVQLELAGRRQGYHATVARLAVLGAPGAADDAAHAALEDALAAAVRALRPGAPVREVHEAFAAAGAVIGAHGIGLDARELPDVGPDADDVLEADSVLAVTVDGPAGRLVETIWVSSQGPKTLNRTRPGLVVLD